MCSLPQGIEQLRSLLDYSYGWSFVPPKQQLDAPLDAHVKAAQASALAD